LEVGLGPDLVDNELIFYVEDRRHSAVTPRADVVVSRFGSKARV
jgi:hypothetical protein